MTGPTESTILLIKILTGSRAYCTNFDDSDHDFIGIFVPKNASYDAPIRSQYKKDGTVFIELREFVNSLKNGDITAHEVLWGHNFKYYTSVFEPLNNIKRSLISKKVINHWINHSEFLFGRAVRIGRIKLDTKDIKDFLKVLSPKSLDFPVVRSFNECLTSGTFEGNNYCSSVLDLKKFGIVPISKLKDHYSIFYDMKSGYSYNTGHIPTLALGIIDKDNDELIVEKSIHDSLWSEFRSRVSIKGILIYDRRAHQKYLKIKNIVNEANIVKDYAPKSMYHAFRIVYSAIHYLKYDQLSVECPNPNYIKKIRTSELSLVELAIEHSKLIKEARELLTTKPLQPHINEVLLDNIEKSIRNSIRQKEEVVNNY